VLHRFFHHELQAAELMCWALLAFPNTPAAFRRGLLAIAQDEIRHLQLYAAHLATLGAPPGSYPVNDWFWSRLPAARSPQMFLATLGVGLEGANLDHALRFAERFARAGDPIAARLQERIAREEVPHVAFAIHWLERFDGSFDFERWRSNLVPPLTPLMMCGDPLNRDDRLRAGFDEPFLDRLERWKIESAGS
jgi:uncharacterized ferritin-like protein (DUF455 family)